MLVMQFGEEPGQAGMQLLDDVLKAFPVIVSLYFTVNEKGNDSIYDLDLELHHGEAYITENMPSPIEGGFPLSFQIGPKSFYQTNPVQAQRLYMEALNLAGITEGDTVYDLYTGTGTIALFMAQKAAKVIGIESVPEAVEAADRNAERNGISHAVFEVGDMRKAFDESFIERHGRPDVVITDPPRDGMHPKVVERLIDLKAPKIVYISCNPATQARDLEKLQAVYDIVTVQPVDMFPQTHHVENVALLHLKNA
jgi:23S rRNA (uracil1939-C5)-methyltransferase